MRRVAFVALSLWMAVAPGLGAGVVAGGDEEGRRPFERTAEDTGTAYVVGRTFLEQQGRAIMPLLQEKARAADHRQRDLARALLLRIESPERAAALYRGIDAWETRLLRDKPGVARVELTQAAGNYAAWNTQPPVPAEGLTYDRTATPLLIDYLRAAAGNSGSGSTERGRPRAVAILDCLADPDAAPALVDALGYSWGPQAKAIEEALVKLNGAALPALRRALADAPVKQVQDSNAARQRAWRLMGQSGAVARVLARLGDRESVPLLVEKLVASEYPQQQTEFAAALGTLQEPRGVPAVFDLLLDAFRNGWFRKKQDAAKYGEARAALLRFGPTAKEHLAKQLVATQPLDVRVLAAGLLFETEYPDAAAQFYESVGRGAPDRVLQQFLPPEDRPGRPSAEEPVPRITTEEYASAGRALYWGDATSYTYNEWMSYDAMPDEAVAPVAAVLAEHALWSGRAGDLERLARLKKPGGAFDVLLETIALARNPDYASPAVRAVALWGGGRAVEELRKLADKPKTVRPDVLVEAALMAGDPAAAGILDAVRATAENAAVKDRSWREAAVLAADVTPAVQGDRAALRKLLEHERPAIRGTAARLLLRQDDTSGVGILLDELAQPQAGQALHTRHELVSRGKAVVAALRQFDQVPAGSPRRVLAAAIALRIADPALAAKFDRAIIYRSFGFFTRMGARTNDYRITGRHIAAEVGQPAVPLLEAEVVAANPWGNGQVAAFALAVFQQKPSMDLLVGMLRDPKGEDRSRGLLAHAIRDFGEEGVAAIKDIPAPNPDKPAFQTRAGRFRGATEALADVAPKTAAENVIKGLTALASDPVQKDTAWVERVRGFLRLAEKVEDPAIIAPILAAIKHHPDSLENAAFRVLSRFDDPRLTSPALEALLSPRGDSARWRSDPLLTLARQLKDQTAALLVKELKESKDAARRANAIEALPLLIGHDYSPWGIIYRKDRGVSDPREVAARKASLEAALDPLLAALDDPDAVVQEAAATALPAIRQSLNLKADDRPVRRLLAWLPKAKAVPDETADFLVWTQHEAVKPALLAAFRDRGRKDRALVKAFRQAGWTEAVPEVYASLKETVANGTWNVEAGVRMQVLEGLPPDGRARLHDVLRDRQMPLGLRVEAARELSGQSNPPLGHEYPKAYDDALALRDEVHKAGDDDLRLKTIRLPYNATKDDVPTRRQSAVESLTITAATLDLARGYPMLMKLFPTLDEGEFRQHVGFLLERMQQRPANRNR